MLNAFGGFRFFSNTSAIPAQHPDPVVLSLRGVSILPLIPKAQK